LRADGRSSTSGDRPTLVLLPGVLQCAADESARIIREFVMAQVGRPSSV